MTDFVQTTSHANVLTGAEADAVTQAILNAVSTQPVQQPGRKSDIAARRAAPSAKKLDKAQREQAKADTKYASLGDAMMQVGESIGYYSVEHDIAQETTIGVVSAILKDAMKQGLDVAMLKAPTKSEPRECYTCLVDALQGVRVSAGLNPLKDSTRDNYLSRIRAYVKARGAEPLDLFGNLAVKKAEQEKKLTRVATESSEADSDEQPASAPKEQQRELVAARGVPALHAYLAEWAKQNDVGMVAEKYRKMVADMIGVIEADLPSLRT